MKVYVPLTVNEASLADGQALVPGTVLKVEDEQMQDPYNKRLMDEGQLIEMDDDDKLHKPRKPRISEEVGQ